MPNPNPNPTAPAQPNAVGERGGRRAHAGLAHRTRHGLESIVNETGTLGMAA